jgi:hypothetical protein
MNYKTQYSKYFIPKLICKFNIVLIKILVESFCDSKMYTETQGLGIARTILKNKTKTLLDIKTK